jgi:hypothetical protein
METEISSILLERQCPFLKIYLFNKYGYLIKGRKNIVENYICPHS